MSGLLALSLQPKGRLFRKGCQIGFTSTRGNHLNLRGKRRCYFIQLRLAPMKFFYYFNLKAHARLIFRTHLKNVFWSNIFVGASLQILRSASADLRFATHKDYKIRREIQQRWTTHKAYKIRRGIPQRWKTRPCRACPGEAFWRRRNLEPKSYF
jgi:hypothetical protein